MKEKKKNTQNKPLLLTQVTIPRLSSSVNERLFHYSMLNKFQSVQQCEPLLSLITYLTWLYWHHYGHRESVYQGFWRLSQSCVLTEFPDCSLVTAIKGALHYLFILLFFVGCLNCNYRTFAGKKKRMPFVLPLSLTTLL